ncbi:MAG: inositol monophosphatase [Minisyncoccia bacterium]
MPNDRYKFTINLIKEAGERVLLAREKEMTVSTKNNDPRDIVTNVDIEISNFISEKIINAFPGEIIYSEESPNVDISTGSFWSIDPIDGTSSFTRAIPHFSVVIAYVEKGVPLVGAVYNPVTRELFSFEKGKGAFLNSKKVNVSNITKLSSAHIFIRVGRNKEVWDWGTNAYKFLLGHANKTANFGSSALDLCFVGTGRIEASIYGNLTAVDIIAAIGFVREAGGMIVGRGGVEVTGLSKEKQTIVAVNNVEILSELREGISI